MTKLISYRRGFQPLSEPLNISTGEHSLLQFLTTKILSKIPKVIH